jgi:ThiF family/Inner membrane component of T3SS, cytoplasmic domain
MAATDTTVISAREGRFARFEAIEWWDQARLARARVLVVGAGALGNEVIKNLALLGVGHLAVTDMDRVELSNLSRSVLFRASDEGRPKAECAARAARGIFPDMPAHALTGKEFLVFKDVMKVGSSPRSDIYLFNDAGVAGDHALLRTVGDACEIEGRDPSFPVLVNNRPITRARLRHGDNVTIGRTMFVFQNRKG